LGVHCGVGGSLICYLNFRLEQFCFKNVIRM
jgi:hypothetical protein